MDPRISRINLAALASARDAFPTRNLFQAFGTPEGILRASRRELEAVEGMRPSIVQGLLAVQDPPCGEDHLARMEKEGIRILSYEEAEYPDNLRRMPDPPPVLFMKGSLLPRDEWAVAVIGSRNASAYGASLCERFVRELVFNGLCIVSGMARGIDAVAHWSSVETGGRTLGVLGTGPEIVYPKANKALFARVPEHGALLSEFLPGTLPRPENFPRRNRIISGLARGVLVVEASVRSGTMITVRMALEQGREVFAVPGDVRSSLSRGTHRLIKQGAKLVEDVEDILQEISSGHQRSDALLEGVRQKPFREEGLFMDSKASGPLQDRAGAERDGDNQEALSREAGTLLSLLNDEGLSPDVLMNRTGWTLDRIMSLLTALELLGKVKRLPGNRIARRA